MFRARAAIFAAAMIGRSAEAAPQAETETPKPRVDERASGRERANAGPMTVPLSAFTGKTEACGDLFAYRASEDGTQIFGVTFKHARSESAIDLGTNSDDVLVTVDVLAEPAADLGCDVLAGPDGPKTTWIAEAGRLETVVGDQDVSFALEDVHLVGPEKGFAVVVPHVVIGAHR